MYIYLIYNFETGNIVTGFLSEKKANEMAATKLDYIVKTVHVQDAQSNPVRG